MGCSTIDSNKAAWTGLLGESHYTLNGGQTILLGDGYIPVVQSLSRSRTDHLYGAPGDTGMSISNDYGATWVHHNVMANNASRYGALPTDTTWFLASGLWDEETSDYEDNFDWSGAVRRRLSSRVDLYHNEQKNQYQVKFRLAKGESKSGRVLYAEELAKLEEESMENKHGRGLKQEDGMWGEIWRTTDGGSVWQRVYYKANEFYFNAIDCCDINNCYAVAEGDEESGSNSPGSRVFRTSDGGDNWSQVYYNSNDASSLMGVHCISTAEAWASGGIIAERGFKGLFLHTTNSGMNWTETDVAAPVMFMDMSDNGQYGIATGLTKSSLGVVYNFQ